jgi:hypothetical protein
VAFVLGLALGARLGAVLALVLVAGAADREAADVTGGEELAVRRRAHAVAADLAHLGSSMLRRFLRVRTHKKRRGEQRIQSSDRSPNEPERGKYHPFPDHVSPHRPPVRAGTPRPDPRWLTASRVASLQPGELRNQHQIAQRGGAGLRRPGR